MDLGLENKVALVLGGGGGLGGAIARALAREGAKLAVADVNAQAAGATADAIRSQGGTAVTAVWDLADRGAAAPVLADVRRELGRIDILVNNTGGPPPTPAAGQDPALWSGQFEAMVASVIALTDAVLPDMRENGWGRIITSASSGVVAPIPSLAISNALRLALVGWSKTLAREVAADGVTCNILVPGRIATARIAFLDQQKAEREGRDVTEVAGQSTAGIPTGRYGDPQEYADVAAFLASTRASYITGSIIRVDGGLIQSI